MARIRTIKPEFPHSESMGRVSREARLCFVMLWTMADDSGRLRGNSRMLASLLFPYDDDVPALMDGWLSDLEGERCLIRYQVDGQSYIQICNWLNHQKIDKPSPSKLPDPPADSDSPREDSRILPVGREGKGMDQGEDRIADKPQKRKCQLPDDFYPDATGIAKAMEAGISLTGELQAFRDHHTAHGNAMLDWQAAWRTWVGKAVKFAARSPPKSDRASKVAEFIGKREMKVING